MENNPRYNTLIDRLKECAQWLACMIGWPDYDVDLAGEDFRRYLEEYSPADGDYPPWGAESALVDYVANLECYSGTGNPFSPIIYVGSELGSSLLEDWSLYFKICADIFWKDIFGVELKCPGIVGRLERDFLNLWGGANERGYKKTPWASYVNALNSPFYQTLRAQLTFDPNLWLKHPFVVYQGLYHTKEESRRSGQEWSTAANFLSILVFNKNGIDNFYIGKKLEESFEISYPKENVYFDELLFLSEANVFPYATGASGSYKLNNFLRWILEEFSQGRIIILHPKKEINEEVKEEILEKLGCQEVFCFKPDYAGSNKPIRLYRFNKHLIISSSKNLTSGVNNLLLLDIARFSKRNRLGGW